MSLLKTELPFLFLQISEINSNSSLSMIKGCTHRQKYFQIEVKCSSLLYSYVCGSEENMILFTSFRSGWKFSIFSLG